MHLPSRCEKPVCEPNESAFSKKSVKKRKRTYQDETAFNLGILGECRLFFGAFFSKKLVFFQVGVSMEGRKKGILSKEGYF